MGTIRLFVDFGSTLTKVVAFDLEADDLPARAQVPSTADRDITVGLERVFERLSEVVPIAGAERRRTGLLLRRSWVRSEGALFESDMPMLLQPKDRGDATRCLTTSCSPWGCWLGPSRRAA